MNSNEYHNRNVYDIIADILTLCRAPMKKTPLRNKVSASEKLLRYCLDDAGLLEVVVAEDNTILFHTTERGQKYLKCYNSLREIMRKRVPMETIFEIANSSW